MIISNEVSVNCNNIFISIRVRVTSYEGKKTFNNEEFLYLEQTGKKAKFSRIILVLNL